MIIKDQLVLASNFETFQVLNERGIHSILWEDCYDNSDLLDLRRRFKTFCNDWYYDERGKDCSLYDGMSIGTAISIYIAYDLETWIRIFYLFEYFASNKIKTEFYVLNKEYFPSVVYKLIEKLNTKDNYWISIKSLELNDSKIEPSLNQIVSASIPGRVCNRLLSKLSYPSNINSFRLMDSIKNILFKPNKEKIRCLVTHVRNKEEYLNSFIVNRIKSGQMRLFFDAHFFLPKRAILNGFFSNKISLIIDDSYNAMLDKSIPETYMCRLLEVAEYSLNKIQFLGIQGKYFFKRILFSYLRKAIKEQIFRYLYLSRIIKKYRINATLCDGHDSPETQYCKHLMDKYGGTSFFIPHGLIRKDRELDGDKSIIAHYYFYYTESEKSLLTEIYNIPSNKFFPIKFLEKNNHHVKDYNIVSETKILILFDNFQLTLASKINYFKSFTDVYKLLKNVSLNNITVRMHGAFFNNYPLFDITTDHKENYFYSLPIQKSGDVPLKDIINNYDIIIGPLTTCVLEAMWAKVFFLPFIPNYFPAITLKEIIKIQWFPELYPKPCQNISQLRDAIMAFVDSPETEYNKYLDSIKDVGNSSSSVLSLWETIESTSN